MKLTKSKLREIIREEILTEKKYTEEEMTSNIIKYLNELKKNINRLTPKKVEKYAKGVAGTDKYHKQYNKTMQDIYRVNWILKNQIK